YRRAQARQYIADFGRMENVETFDREWDAPLRKFMNQLIAMAVLAIKHRKIAPLAALLPMLLLNPIGEVGGLDLPAQPGNDFDRQRYGVVTSLRRLLVAQRYKGRPLVRNRVRRLREHLRVLRHNAKSAAQDRRKRAPILFQGHDSRPRKFLGEQRERFARSATELIDRLVRIAHDKNVRLRSG